jgi:hypothetical protein
MGPSYLAFSPFFIAEDKPSLSSRPGKNPARKIYSIKIPNLQAMEYSFKRGFKPDIERIHSVLAEEFPTDIAEADGKLQLSYGALKSICVWIDGKKLNVTTESDSGASDQVVLDTNKRFRDFLEKATGYTAKQRLQMAKKEVSKGGD